MTNHDVAVQRDTTPHDRAISQPSHRFPNFDLLRLLAAVAVILSHAFILVNGNEDAEPLVRLLGPHNILGVYGVYTFFIISGFLITASFQKSSLPRYLAKRCLRILPALAACTLVTVTLAALYASPRIVPWHDQRRSALYAVKTVLLLNTSGWSLPGVVFSSNDFGRLINGSLWTLQPEFLCYLAVAALGLAALLRLPVAILVLIAGLYTHHTGALGNVGFFIPFFAAGSALYLWRGRPALNRWNVAGAAAGLALGAVLGFASIAFALFGAWLVIGFATGPFQIHGATRFGDLSYGIYLYGWPVEQTTRGWLGSHATWWLVFLIALPVASLAAAISWRLVEAPSLRLATRRAPGPTPAPPAQAR